MHASMSLEYEPSWQPQHFDVQKLFRSPAAPIGAIPVNLTPLSDQSGRQYTRIYRKYESIYRKYTSIYRTYTGIYRTYASMHRKYTRRLRRSLRT